jgi:peptide chain release factor 3
MELEKQRGISITSSVMQFEYEGYCINILDTPGHQDFSEDTYRTLMAADSAVMVIDAAKGIEPQTRKLFRICAMRHIPIFTFINKLDREARSPYELMEELENEFGIGTYPMNWPIGCGQDFKGVYDREKRQILAFTEFHRGQNKIKAVECSLDDTEKLDELIGEKLRRPLADDIELLDGAGYDFDLDAVRAGRLSPVFFGSALNNFGVEPFLESFLRMTMPPLPRVSEEEIIDPFDERFSAFVFKIQANMNKAHRDRIAFMRICSGKFEREKEYFHVQGGKALRLAQPQQLMAQERAVIDEAYAGDIIGVFDPGIFSIGDTICEKGMNVRFEGIPTFAPEHFAGVERVDTMKRKQFEKGIQQIAQEGAIQIFHEPFTGVEEVIVGVVGVLQFEVLEYRLKTEYGVDIRRRAMPYEVVRWVENENIDIAALNLTSDTKWVQDFRGNDLLLFTSEWCVNWALQKNEGLELREFNRE